MSIDFTHPWFLFLLALAPVAILVARRGAARLSGARALAAISIRLAIVLLVVLAIAGLRVKTSSSDVALIFLVDLSASMPTQERERALQIINQAIDRMSPEDYLGIVSFAREPLVELAPGRKEVVASRRITEFSSSPASDRTNIAAALRLAAAIVPESATGRFLLLSDGNENIESVEEQIQFLRSQGIKVYSIPLSTSRTAESVVGEVAVRELASPGYLAEGEPFELTVVIDSTKDTAATLRILRNSSLVSQRQVQLTSAGDNVFVLPQLLTERGFYTFRAEVEALGADTFVQNNVLESFTVVDGVPKVLYVHGDPRPAAGLLRVFEEASFRSELRRREFVPTTLAECQDFDLIVFDNVPASVLTPGQMKALRAYVRELGGGFLMVGGDQSFGPGGYFRTPVEDLLPVSLDVRRKKHFPSLGLVLVIDRSGSMEGEKIRLAKEAAVMAVELLSEQDSVGVIAFDAAAHAVVSLTPATDKPSIHRRIRSISSSGGTDIHAGLVQAVDWLGNSDAQIRHVIVLSDGETAPADFAGLVSSLTREGMTLSTVAVGRDADINLMQLLAAGGGGRFYATDNPRNLPQIFSREAFLASRATIIEEPFIPLPAGPSPAIVGIDWAGAPELQGYVGVSERDGAGSSAITSLVSHRGDPVFASWQYGLGRAGAFTSDARSRWAALWLEWPGYGKFWAQVFRDLIRRPGSGELTTVAYIDDGEGRIVVEAISAAGEFRNGLRLSARVVDPALSTYEVPLEQTAPGRYEGGFTALDPGAYLVAAGSGEGERAGVAGAVSSYSPEFAIGPLEQSVLLRLAGETGGSVLNESSAHDAASLFSERGSRWLPREIWEGLLLAAMLLLPLDVGIRRVRLSREQLNAARERLRKTFTRDETEVEAARPTPEFARLKASRDRLATRPVEATRFHSSSESEPRRAAPPRPAPPAGQVEPAPEPSTLAAKLLQARRNKRYGRSDSDT